MKTLKILISVQLTLGLLACPTVDPDEDPLPAVEELFPGDSEVGSWVRDADPIDVATSNQEALDLINGEATAFIDRDFVAFAMGGYEDGQSTLELRIWEFADAATAKDLYDNIPDEFGEYQVPWEDAAVGEAGRIVNPGTRWWLNTHEGIYFIEVIVRPTDAGLRQATLDFALVVVASLP